MHSVSLGTIVMTACHMSGGVVERHKSVVYKQCIVTVYGTGSFSRLRAWNS